MNDKHTKKYDKLMKKFLKASRKNPDAKDYVFKVKSKAVKAALFDWANDADINAWPVGDGVAVSW